MGRLSASGSVCRPPAGDEVDAAPQPDQSERDEARVAVEPDLHAEVEGGFRLDVTPPGVDIGADVGESLSGQCQVAVAEGGKEELADRARELDRRSGHCRDRHEGKGGAPYRERREPCPYDCRRFGPHDRKTDTEKGNSGRQVSRACTTIRLPNRCSPR